MDQLSDHALAFAADRFRHTLDIATLGHVPSRRAFDIIELSS